MHIFRFALGIVIVTKPPIIGAKITHLFKAGSNDAYHTAKRKPLIFMGPEARDQGSGKKVQN